VPDAAAPSLCHQAVALPYIAGGLGANPVAAVGGLDLPYKLSSEGPDSGLHTVGRQMQLIFRLPELK
jgi:hypothetical protein